MLHLLTVVSDHTFDDIYLTYTRSTQKMETERPKIC